MSRGNGQSRTEEIERIAARLFARKGYHSTSMREIARELGMNQSTLYHYYRNKEEILFKLMNGAVDDALITLEEICAGDFTAEEKLKRVLHFYTRYYAGDQDRLFLLVHEMASLGEGFRPILTEKQKRYVQLITSILKELADHEKMRKVDPNVAAFAFFGMVHYTPKWYRKEGAVGLDQLADLFVDILTRGILV